MREIERGGREKPEDRIAQGGSRDFEAENNERVGRRRRRRDEEKKKSKKGMKLID